MKTITKFLVALTIIFCSSYTQAQCGPGQNLLQNIGNVSGIHPGTSEYGQSFIVGCNGAIEAIELRFRSVAVASTGTLRMYSDEAGTVVIGTSATVSLPTGNSTQIISFNTPVTVISGTSYIFTFTEDNPEEIFFLMSPVNVYADGNLKFRTPGSGAFTNFADYDLRFEIIYRDDIVPTALCQNITAQLDATGTATILPADVDGGSSDDSGSVILTLDNDTFDCSTIGINTVTLTVADAAGNTVTCMATVTVEDTILPTITCPADITINNNSGTCQATVTVPMPTVSDNCGIISSHSESSPVTPFIFTPTGNPFKPLLDTPSTLVGAQLSLSDVTFELIFSGYFSGSNSCFDLEGPDGNTVYFGCNLNSLCYEVVTQSITIPQATWNSWVGTFGSDLTFTLQEDPDVVDLDCSGVQETYQFTAIYDINATAINDFNGTNNASGIYPVGTTNVIWTFTDNSGNPTSCTQVIKVIDNEPPVAICQNITVQLDATGNANITASNVDGASTDNCEIDTLSIDIDTFDCSNVGTNNVTLTVTDVNGNSSSCVTVVTVEDTIDPIAVCQDITVQLDANGDASIVAADVDGGSSDACGIDTLSIDIDTFDCSNIGTNNVTLTVTDVNGNSSSCVAVVNVEDTIDPIAVCQDITVQLDANGDASIVAADLDGGSTDACGIDTLSIDIDTFDCSHIGTNNVILTVTDVNGNSSSCVAIVTVEDNVAPIAMCAAPFTIQLDAAGMASITIADIENGSTDACGIASTSIDVTDFTCANVGPNTVTLTVADNNGNIATCTTIVTVEDTIDPVAVCMNITVQLDASGTASIVPADVDGGSSDACGIDTLSIDIDTFDCSNVGTNNVTLTVTDVNGNSSSCIAIVTVEDNIAPLMNCPADFTVGTDAEGMCGANVSFAAPIPIDTCGIDTVVQTAGLPSGSVFPVGASVIEYTATDVNGNTTTCSFTITVVDNDAPIAVCMDITIQLDAAGNATIVPADVDGGSTDNCAVDTLSINVDTFTCADLGANNVVLTVTDTAGLTSTCTAIVTVEDITPPTVVCQDITVSLDATGTVTIDPSLLDGGSTDSCGAGIFTYSATPDTFTCAELGDNTVTLTVTDENGNSATCDAMVTVEDDTAPTIVCQDITVQLEENGMVTIVATDLIANADDACGVATTAVDIDTFTCDDLGTSVTVTVAATDASGNSTTCTAMVTVVDEFAPQFDTSSLPEDQVRVADESGEYILEDFTTDVIVTDNCSILDAAIVLGQDPAIGTVLTVGVYDITLSAEDDFGNLAEYVFELEVTKALSTGENSFDIASLTIYPNPATDLVLLSNPQNIPLKEVSIYDVTGRLIKKIDASKTTSEVNIDVSELASATYMIIINTDAGQVTMQLVKK